MKLFEAGLLAGEDGKLSEENRNRILEAFGFASYENAGNLSALHTAKAGEENLKLKKGGARPRRLRRPRAAHRGAYPIFAVGGTRTGDGQRGESALCGAHRGAQAHEKGKRIKGGNTT
ncbi:MAG: hypothetical protein ACLR06_14025 [Christensenellaceae bacterium]